MEAGDTVWLPVLPSMKGFGPALVKGAGGGAAVAGKTVGATMGKAMMIGIGASIAGGGVALAGLYKVGKVFDDMTETIRVGSGAAGADLDGLVDSAKTIGRTVPAEFDKIGGVVADVSTRMGLTGETMETVASQYLEAGRILGEDVDVGKTSAAFNAFKIEGEDVSGALDHLFQVSQATGIGMNELAGSVSMNAPAVQSLGFGFEEAAVMVGSFDKAGLNSSQMMSGMSRSLVNLAKDGEEPAEAFQRTVGEIDGFIKAGDTAAAIDLAGSVFGTRGASQFIGAIESGTLNLDEMTEAAGQTGDTILGLGEETMDFEESWQLFKNNVLVWLEPLGARVFGALGDAMKLVTDAATAFGDAWQANDGKVSGATGIIGMAERLASFVRPIFDELSGGIEAFAAAWKYNDGEITSAGFPGFMERVAGIVRPLWDELTGGIEAFSAAWEYNDGEITSSGFPGFMERLGYWARQAFDYLNGTAIPALGDFARFLWDNREVIGVVASAIGVLMLPALVRLGISALVNGAKAVLGWAMQQTAAFRAGVVYVAQSLLIIGRWVAMGVAAVISGAQTVAVWALYRLEALKSAGAMALQALRIVGSWVLMGAQSLLQGARMAAAWVLAMGPVGWVIAAIVGLAAIVIANWDSIVQWTTEAWQNIVDFVVTAWQNIVSWVTTLVADLKHAIEIRILVVQAIWRKIWTNISDFFSDTWAAIAGFFTDIWEDKIKPVLSALGDFISDTVAPAFQRGVDAIKKIWETIKDIAGKPVEFMIETVYNNGIRGLVNGLIDGLGLPFDTLPKLAFEGFASGGWTGPGGKYDPAGVVHADEYVVNKASRRRVERERPGLLDHLNQYGTMAGYADGGRVRRPVRGGPVTSGFGESRGQYPHAGIDFGVPIGTDVLAAMRGTVLRAAWNAVSGRSGKGMLLGHEGGRSTYYGHLSEMLASVGQTVGAGDVIGKSGNTGRSTGPHLHFETWSGNDPVDPAPYLGGALLPGGGGGMFDGIFKVLDFVTGLPQQFAAQFPDGGLFVDMMVGTGEKIFGGIGDAVGGAIGAVGDFLDPQGGGIFDTNKGSKDAVRGVAGGYGWGGGGQWDALHELVNRESSWNVNAANPNSSARGLFQKMTSLHGPAASTAEGQARWGLHYIASRYGSPSSALAHHNRNGHYADGGHVKPVANVYDTGGVVHPGVQLIANKSRRDELMLNHQDALRTAEALHRAGSDGGGLHVHGNVHVTDEAALVDALATRRKQAYISAGLPL